MWAHHNDFHDNATGIATDSLFPGHPGLPQDHARWGTMQFWVPSPLRDEYDPTKLYDTSNGNRTFENKMGIRPDGSVDRNGLDHWWDDQGVGNCWEDNESSREGGVPTTNFLVDPGPCPDGGSVFLPGAPVKDAGFLSCSQYDRNDPTWRHPPGCEWFESPEKPTDEPSGPVGAAAGSGRPGGPAAPLAGPGVSTAPAAGLVGVGLLAALGTAAARRRGPATVGA